MKTAVSTKGQIVLPAEIRRQDGIEPGEEFEIERIDRGEYRLIRLSPPRNHGLLDWLLACPEKGFFVPIESESSSATIRSGQSPSGDARLAPEGNKMATKTVELSEAQGQLAELVAQAAAGTEVVLTEGNTPRARLVAVAAGSMRRVPGLHPASMEASDDFDAPLPDEFWAGSA